MTFDSLVKRLLNEMAIEKESDIVYLSQLLNQPRLTSDDINDISEYEPEIAKSVTRLTSRGFPKAMRNHFGAKIKYPMRIVVDDVNDENNAIGSRKLIESDIVKPMPGVITFYLHPGIGAAQALTPFLIGHNLGHTLQHLYPNGVFSDYRRGDLEPYIETVTTQTVKEIARENPEYPWYFVHTRSGQTEEVDDDLFDAYAYPHILTPNIAKISEGFDEWIPNLVALYMKYGKIKFRVGSAHKIEEYIDKVLHSFLGKVVAIG